MDNFFDAIKRFVLENQDKEDRYGLVFIWGDGNSVKYTVAEDIANMLVNNEINDEFNRERIEELEDYNRLLRKENQELRDCKVEMDQNYESAIAAMRGYSGEDK